MALEVVPPPRELPEPSADERTLAMFCHLSVLFGSVFVPIGIYLWKGQSSPYIAFHAKQAIAFQLGAFFLAFTLMCLSLGFVVLIVAMILGVMRALTANQGEWKGYPLIERLGLPE